MARRFQLGLALAGVLCAWLLLAPRAHAGTYSVAQCGWGLGVDAAWTGNTSHFRSSTSCGSDTPGAKSLTVANGRRTGLGVLSRWRWTAPPGAAILGVRGWWWRSLDNGFQQRIAAIDNGGGRAVLRSSGSTDTGPNNFFESAPGGGARAMESELECRHSPSCEQSPVSWAAAGKLIFTLSDPAGPSLVLGGPLAAGGWLRGAQAFEYSASDNGSGVATVEALVDGDLQRRVAQPCRTVSVDGAVRGARMMPCEATGTGSETLSTGAFADGGHTVTLCGTDFSGGRTCLDPVAASFDNTAPSAPVALEVEGGGEWRASNGFSIGWRNPDQGAGSPLTGAWYRLRSAAGTYDSGPLQVAGADGALEGINLPWGGAYEVSVWLADEAGNSDEARAETATLRFDDIPPGIAFANQRDPEHPEQIVATARDSLSGIAAGGISFRRLGEEDWTALPTALAEAEPGVSKLEARFPSDDVEPGTYEFRAEAADRAGNRAASSAREDGAPMVLEAPLKTETLIRAHFRGHDASDRTVLVGYGSSSALLGTLRIAGGGPVEAAEIEARVFPAAGSAAGPSVQTAHTDTDGSFSVPLPAGPSRGIELRYAGNETLAAARSGDLRLRSRGRITSRARRLRLRNGEVLTLKGAVGMLGARPPAAGKLVEIQFRDRTRHAWQPVAVFHARHGGRYRWRHRFMRISRPTRIAFRAVALGEADWPYEQAVSRVVRVSVRP
jgi:hypothetical protein